MDPITPAQGQAQAAKEFEAAITQAQTAGVPANQATPPAVQPTQSAPAATEPPAVQPVKIGEEEYTHDQLAELVQKGKTVKEWEISKPGYNLDSLYADYTKKSMKLAELERQQPEPAPEEALAPEEQAILNKHVNPLIQSAIQQERDAQALDTFKKSHTEYSDSAKFAKFISFFNSYYKLPTDVTAQITVMEMAHQNMNFDAEVQKKAQQAKGQTLADIQKLEMASVGGGSQKTTPGPYDSLTPEQQKYMKEFGF